MKSFTLRVFFLIIIFQFFGTNFLIAQNVPASENDSDSIKNFNFVPVPYLNYNRSTGFAFGALPMAMYNLNKKDTISPQSLSGMMGFYTTNKTWFLLAFSRFYFDEDKWRVNVAAGTGNINFQFYLSDPFDKYFDYNTGAKFAYVGFERKTIGSLYTGLNFMISTAETSLTNVDSFRVSDNNFGLGLSLAIDQRSDPYYPRSGFISNLNFKYFIGSEDKENAATKLEFDYNQYFSSRNNTDVIAARFYAGIGLGDLDFTQQFVVGRTDIRGYSDGKYRADNMMALQGEYRWNIHKKISAVGFAGVATVFEALNEDQNWKPLPGIGVGFRYNIFPKNHMNVGIDFATGIDDWGIYFKIGEAF